MIKALMWLFVTPLLLMMKYIIQKVSPMLIDIIDEMINRLEQQTFFSYNKYDILTVKFLKHLFPTAKNNGGKK